MSDPTGNEARDIAIPASWYLGAHGDPVAQFDRLVLTLHPDGTVTWWRWMDEVDEASLGDIMDGVDPLGQG